MIELTVLFIIEDGLKTTFYLYVLNGSRKKLLRFSPELLLTDGASLAQKFMDLPIDKFLLLFEAMTHLSIQNYVISNKKELVAFLLRDSERVLIENPQAFTYEAENYRFDQGEIAVDQGQMEAFISYQLDNGNPEGIYERQEYVLRLIRNDLLRDKRITAIPKRFNALKKRIRTNLGVSDLLKFFRAYKERGYNKTQRLTVPKGDVNPQDIDIAVWLQEIKQFLV